METSLINSPMSLLSLTQPGYVYNSFIYVTASFYPTDYLSIYLSIQLSIYLSIQWYMWELLTSVLIPSLKMIKTFLCQLLILSFPRIIKSSLSPCCQGRRGLLSPLRPKISRITRNYTNRTSFYLKTKQKKRKVRLKRVSYIQCRT